MSLDRTVGFDELLWLRELHSEKRTDKMPEHVRASLLTRGLIERHVDSFVLTSRGRIALEKLG